MIKKNLTKILAGGSRRIICLSLHFVLVLWCITTVWKLIVPWYLVIRFAHCLFNGYRWSNLNIGASWLFLVVLWSLHFENGLYNVGTYTDYLSLFFIDPDSRPAGNRRHACAWLDSAFFYKPRTCRGPLHEHYVSRVRPQGGYTTQLALPRAFWILCVPIDGTADDFRHTWFLV